MASNGKVRCVDCDFVDGLKPNHNGFTGKSDTDKYCDKPTNGQTLLNAMRNNQAIRSWRFCEAYKPKEA